MQKEINTHIGSKIRELRISLKLNQQEIGDLLNISYQQIQKYEKGIDRVSATMLHTIATNYGKPFSWFFEEPVNELIKQEVSYNKIILAIPEPGRSNLMKFARTLMEAK